MPDYKETLNLPQTNFPMRANLAHSEPKILQKWQADGLYQLITQQNKARKFILHDGPPYANGNIHVGHAVNKILKDAIIKSKRLSGFDAPFVPGWDCHGLPIELNVEKKSGRVGQKINAQDFRLACRQYADKQIKAQKADFERLGILADWQNPYLTKNYQYEADIIRALGKIVENGHLSSGVKPVHWCCDCRSALAEAEVEYQDKTSPAIYVKFALVDSTIFALDKPLSVVIWTTTPWTLPANAAVAAHPELDYVIVATAKEYLLVAQDCLANLGTTYIGTIGQTIKGRTLENIQVKHPFYDKEVPIILAEYVSSEAGTGLVHTAPSHGQDDFLAGLKYQLTVDNLVNDQGVFFEDVPLVGGQFVFAANKTIIAELAKNNVLLQHQDLTHSYPHCWRHKSPVIFRATPQWFIAMDKKNLRQDALAQINKVDWLPNWGKKRIELMIKNRPDWCISRQRTWGVPITLLVHKKSKQLHQDTVQLIEKIAKKVQTSGIETWFKLEVQDLLGEEADDYEKVADILDVWFDSGVSHFAALEKIAGLDKPADLYLEGSDQHRGWFQSSLLSSVALGNKTAPYKAVLTHGFFVDGEGKKMSKSLGNVISPQKVVNEFGADILRLWVVSNDYTNEMTISHSILKNTSDGYRRIRNTLRFMLANMFDFSPKNNLCTFGEMLALDVWILDKTENLQTNIIKYYENYRLHSVCQAIISFCSNELGKFYLDIIKDRLYTCQKNSTARRSAQTALYHISQAMLRWIAPILSFTAYEAWAEIPENDKALFTQEWYKFTEETDSPNNPITLKEILPQKEGRPGTIDAAKSIAEYVRQEIEKLRDNKEIGSSLETEITIYINRTNPDLTYDYQNLYDEYNQSQTLQNELRFMFITSVATIEYFAQNSTDATESKANKIAIKVSKSQYPKCVRCWHHRPEIGQNTEHPKLCGRCVENITGAGEKREFA